MSSKEVTIVAIDGPSGVGKSTVGRAVAKILGIPYVDTGAMYRAVGLASKRAGIALPISDPEAVIRLGEAIRIDLRPDPELGVRVLLDGEEVTSSIRDPEISMYASAVSAIPRIRRMLVARQQEIGREAGGVLEGRDIGTVVFPETPHKFFLTASPAVRADRRVGDLRARGSQPEPARILAEQEARDLADSTREDSPLICDERYQSIDTSKMTIEEVIQSILDRVQAK